MAILAQCPTCRTKQKVANKRCKCGEDMDKAKKANRVQYWVSYYLPGGKNRREPAGFSIDVARDAEGKRRAQKREGRFFDMLPDSKKTFADLAEWFIDTAKIKNLSSRGNVVRHLVIFNETFGRKQITALTRDELLSFKFAERKNGRADSYIDQIVDSARWMVTDALEDEQIAGDCLKPFRKLKPFCKKGQNARKRVLSLEEYNRLMEALLPHLKPIVATAWWTGMRQAEILELTWDRVDLAKRFIYLRSTDTKEAKSKVVPISKPLRDILMQLPGRGGEGVVFKYAGERHGRHHAGDGNGVHRRGHRVWPVQGTGVHLPRPAPLLRHLRPESRYPEERHHGDHGARYQRRHERSL